MVRSSYSIRSTASRSCIFQPPARGSHTYRHVLSLYSSHLQEAVILIAMSFLYIPATCKRQSYLSPCPFSIFQPPARGSHTYRHVLSLYSSHLQEAVILIDMSFLYIPATCKRQSYLSTCPLSIYITAIYKKHSHKYLNIPATCKKTPHDSQHVLLYIPAIYKKPWPH